MGNYFILVLLNSLCKNSLSIYFLLTTDVSKAEKKTYYSRAVLKSILAQRKPLKFL